MKELGNFKNIADEIMNNVSVSNELKEKTLTRCRKRNNAVFAKILVPAACMAAIIAAVNIFGLLPKHTNEKSNPEANIMMEATRDNAAKTAEFAAETSGPSDSVRTQAVTTLEEAGRLFGSNFLTPSFIPGKLKLESIQVSASGNESASLVVLSYLEGSRSFVVIEGKSKNPVVPEDFQSIDINGSKGYIRTDSIDNSTEVYWFLNGVQYSVTGNITEDEAVDVARFMK